MCNSVKKTRLVSVIQALLLSTCAFLCHGLHVTAQTFEVDTIVYHGNPNKFINIVFLGDGYQNSELSSYITDVQNASDYLFTLTPFDTYKNYFNVFAIRAPSGESGTDHPGTATDVTEPVFPVATVNTYFNSTFDYASIHRLLVPTNYSAINSVLINNFPLSDQTVVLVNSTEYGGSGGSNATSSIHSAAYEIVAHELGHSFGGLADEYYAGDQYAGERSNMTQETDPNLVKWKNWMGDEGIGIYQHCCGDNSEAWYRPHQGCKMRALGPQFPFCAVCKETIVERIHQLFGTPVITYQPSQSTVSVCTDPMEFGLELARPDPNTLKLIWKLNGTTLAMNLESVTITPEQLHVGGNTLSAQILDTTSLTRSDQHLSIHIYTRNWTINYEPASLPEITTNGTTTFCEGNSVILTSSPSYLYLWNTGATTQSIATTAEGEYAVTVTNAYGCSAISDPTTVTVLALPYTEITVNGATSHCNGDSVTLTSTDAEAYLWSNDATTQSTTVFDAGTYSVTVTDEEGCTGVSSPILVEVLPFPLPTIMPDSTIIFCLGDSVILTASAARSYLWSNDDTTQSIMVYDSGIYAVMVTDENGCTAISAATTIIVNPLPPIPVISANDATLTSSAKDGNQWFLEGKSIEGATSQAYTATENGIYTVAVTDSNGCTSMSEPYDATSVGILLLSEPAEIVLIPNPNYGTFRIQIDESPFNEVRVYDAHGRIVYVSSQGDFEISLTSLPKGIYFILVIVDRKSYVSKLILI